MLIALAAFVVVTVLLVAWSIRLLVHATILGAALMAAIVVGIVKLAAALTRPACRT